MKYQYNESNNSWKPDQSDFNSDTLFKKWCDPRQTRTLIGLGIMALVIAIFVIGFLTLGGETMNQDDVNLETLKLTSIVFRHGARNPSGTYNSDPYKNYNWPGGLGALTNLGKQQMFNLGKTFRKKYKGYLPNEYNDDDIYIKGSDKSRTLMSAYTFLAGLYPPPASQLWNSDILWQPIPVHSLPRELDALLAAKKNCNTYDLHFDLMKNSTEIQNVNKKYDDLYKNLTLYCNQTMNSPLAVELLYSHLEIERDNGLTLPEWTKGIFPEMMKDLPGYSLAIHSYDEVMIRLKGGPLLSEILENMKEKIMGILKPDRKMFLYSAHDLTIVNLWRALTFEEIILPQFGAALVIELHTLPESTDSEIKLLYYNSSSTTQPHPLEMPHCGIPCTLSQFENLTKKYIPVDWEKECANDSV